ncbi:peroxisomal copper amine oxidase [Gymnopilus junonius]|uniref:Amine oxidase n=1 Tax=Gymnopilus junonius TaxID=109634 RepID=A0A9P5NVN7_GYMJU|nr:peroxisomal copper amine oxidase [Gymnopilus junonius]
MSPDGTHSTTTVPSTISDVQQKPKQIPTAFKHPLDPLTPDEIAAVSFAIRHHIAAKTDTKAIKFITCSLLPPPKKAVLAYLGIPLAPGEKPESPVPIVRKAEVDYIDIVNGGAFNVILTLKEDGKWEVESLTRLAEEFHPQISPEELLACEVVVRNNPTIQKLAADVVSVLPHQIVCDGWSIGYDDRFPQKRRVQQALMYARFSEHDNLYAHPLDFIPVIDANTEELLHVDFPPHYSYDVNGKPELSTHSTAPPPTDADSLAVSKRDRIPPPHKAFDFLPDLMAQTEEGGYHPRQDVKPLHIVQPEGVSFKMDGHVLEWQNWKMHIAFTHREGIALSTITYNDNGIVRPIMYRLSLAEMVVPYGAPEHPHPRKFAFDSGEYGMGTMANELSLGCDCVGQIHYLPGSYIANDGSALVIKNVICIHEEDAGVLWKHTDYRPNGRSQTVRRRRLVVSMVCTLANYEYIWNYQFYQDGTIELEIRLTGILNVYVSKDGEPSPFGTIVAPNIVGQYHQHLFSLRVDPMVDGLKNTVIESDILPVDAPTGSKENFAGNAFFSKDTPIKVEGGRPYDFDKERRWRIVNSAKKHYSSGKAVGYNVAVKGGATPMMAKLDSWTAKRASFLTNTVWVVKDEEAEGSGTTRMWPSGKYVPQTKSEPEDSVGAWVKGEKEVEDEDILVFVTVGTTHIPRPEDWPVMPVEHLTVAFKPNSFFKANPSMDVPGTRDPRSVPAFSDNATATTSSNHSCH